MRGFGSCEEVDLAVPGPPGHLPSTLPTDSLISLHIYALHRNSTVWPHPDVLSFWAQRSNGLGDYRAHPIPAPGRYLSKAFHLRSLTPCTFPLRM